MNKIISILIFLILLISTYSFNNNYKDATSTISADSISQMISYPEMMKLAKIEGRNQYKLIIDEYGNVENIIILKSIGTAFDQSSIPVLKSIKFKPAIRDGLNVKSSKIISVRFQL